MWYPGGSLTSLYGECQCRWFASKRYPSVCPAGRSIGHVSLQICILIGSCNVQGFVRLCNCLHCTMMTPGMMFTGPRRLGTDSTACTNPLEAVWTVQICCEPLQDALQCVLGTRSVSSHHNSSTLCRCKRKECTHPLSRNESAKQTSTVECLAKDMLHFCAHYCVFA